MVNARAKGARGEREFCKWLQEKLDLPITPERNLDQVRNGGADIVFPPFIFEIKRCELLAQRKWWLQVKKASRKMPGLIPVVCYRRNKLPWKFLIPKDPYGYVEMKEEDFIRWMKNEYRKNDHKHVKF
ncbi:MAG: hypothetical protein DRO88_02580 [Promethearchaeia archaeon]|nr:MAG: hypothetical protein DRO88_02580 [Candidatus Lokiarchaeia archaeon]